jgi:hypothetical protein
MGHSVIETPEYLADAKAADLSEAERTKIVDSPAIRPLGSRFLELAERARLGFPVAGKARAAGIE